MPAVASVEDTVLEAVAAVVAALGLADWNSALVPVVVRKRSDALGGQLDVLPVILVAPSRRPGQLRQLAFGNVRAIYAVSIAARAQGNRDFSDVHLDYLTGWRLSIRQPFQKPKLAGAPTVYNVEIVDTETLDQAAGTTDSQDVTLLELDVWSAEAR